MRIIRALGALLLLGSCSLTLSVRSDAQAKAPLVVVPPVMSCSALAETSLTKAVGVNVTLQATTVQTEKGPFCHVTGTIAPAIHLEVDLPQDHWTQRFLQAGCGGLCGMINASIGNAGGCLPALNGEFVVAATDMGHQGQMGGPGQGDFAADPQKRIDFAYRANHLTALTAKALIKAYYGQAQRFAYFSGCSDGGREALMEAQRFPDDFDGVSAGAPAMYFQVQNSLNHAWTQAANTRADGTKILQQAKLEILHTAVIDHCDMLDGVMDGLLSDPRVCKVQPQWVACAAGATDTSHCLTQEEWVAANKIYTGPTDSKGNHFLPGGWQPGSEMQWAGGMPGGGDAPRPPRPDADSGALPKLPDGMKPGAMPSFDRMMAVAMAPVVFTTTTPADTDLDAYPFTMEQFHRATALHGLNDATNTNLLPFASHGGKLIMYHGWSDTSIAPLMSVAYYTAVQRDLGAAKTDTFLRLFMIPGMGHCGGGDGFSQVDTLTALMAWVEDSKTPAMLIADKVQGRPGMGGGPDGRGGQRQTAPYARANQAAVASRPLYPFPSVAEPTGSDLTVASSFTSSQGLKPSGDILKWTGAELLAPKAAPFYEVVDGKLTAK